MKVGIKRGDSIKTLKNLCKKYNIKLDMKIENLSISQCNKEIRKIRKEKGIQRKHSGRYMEWR